MATMADMHTVFIDTNLETRLVLLLHKDDHVSAFKDKFSKVHVQCFPNFGEITVSAVKVNWQDQYYHLSDSMIMSKAFEALSSERFIFVDVASVEEMRDPTHEEALQIQAAEEKTKKRKMKSSSSATKSRKKLDVVPTQCTLLDESNESGEGNVISLAENQNTCDANQEGLVDVNADKTLDEAMEQDIGKGERNAVVMIDQEKNLEKDNEKGDNGEKDGEEAKPVKLKNKTKSRKDNKTGPKAKDDTLVDPTAPNAVLALSAPKKAS